VDRDLASTVLYAVGSLPFWTGRRKLQRFLRGEPGSFWENETPLKPLYLNHHFYGALGDRRSAEISRVLQILQRADYLERTRLSEDKPYPVLKLTGRGVLKYYNLLVLDRGIQHPTWWIHHLARLEQPPGSSIRTGGHVLSFSERTYLTQTPDRGDVQERVRDEKTLPLRDPPDDLRPGSSCFLEGVRVRPVEDARLGFDGGSGVRAAAAEDLRRELTHFSARTVSPDEPDPYVLRGTLVDDEEDPDRLLRWLTLENERNQRVRVALPQERLDADVPIERGGRYVVGPVRRHRDAKASPEVAVLQVRPGGSLRREDRPAGDDPSFPA